MSESGLRKNGRETDANILLIGKEVSSWPQKRTLKEELREANSLYLKSILHQCVTF